MNERLFVVVSGLPASGKSTVAKKLGESLRLPVIDKDLLMESLFESLGVGDGDWRKRLSRASDALLYEMAASSQGAILVNWWHHDSSPGQLQKLSDSIIEVYCDCPIDVALSRFEQRQRHQGHLDEQRLANNEIAAQQSEAPGPLKIGGPLIIVDTTKHVNTEDLADRIHAL